MEAKQDLTWPSNTQQQRQEGDHQAALVPARTVLAGLSPDLWRLVCSFVADSPLWLFATWARVCRTANGPSARPAAPPFALDLRKIRGKVPSPVWKEWKELACLTFRDMEARTRQPVFAALAASRTQVHAISLDAIEDLDLVRAAGINGLGSIEQTSSFADDRKSTYDSQLAQLSGMHRLTLRDIVAALNRQLTDIGLRHLSGLHRLEHLNLSYCPRFTDGGLVHLSGLHQLKHIDLGRCWQLTDAGLVHLSGLSRLEHLNLSSCSQLTDAGLVHLAGFHQLKHLDLGQSVFNQRGQFTDAGLVHLSGLPRLEHLSLEACEYFTDAGLVHLSGLHQLQHLTLARCRQLTDAGLVHLSNLHQLKHLDFGECWQLTNAGLVHLSNLPTLEHLGLNSCWQLTDAGMAHLSGLHQLTHLDLGRCRELTDVGLVHLSGIRSLRYISLSNRLDRLSFTDAGFNRFRADTEIIIN